jgi:4-hydroxy-2-oxoheptanedioate aldolase
MIHAVVLVQCEIDEIGRAAQAIADLDGVDGLFVGPSDLGLDLRLEGDAFEDVLRRIANVCRDRGKLPGAFRGGAERIAGWVELGYEFLAVSSDAALLLDAARSAVSAARLALPPGARR